MAHILVVDDDKKTVATITLYLEADGHTVDAAYSGVEALERFRERTPDLVVLDVMLPTIDGIDVTRLIRIESGTPIILVTARTFEDDKLKGFAEGVDDYVTKPFSPRELVARVKALLRRSATQSAPQRLVESGPVTIDPSTHRATVGDTALELTRTEFALLLTLAQSPGRVYPRNELVRRVFGDDYQGLERSLDTHLSNLRHKLGDKHAGLIRTIHGVGYTFEIPQVT